MQLLMLCPCVKFSLPAKLVVYRQMTDLCYSALSFIVILQIVNSVSVCNRLQLNAHKHLIYSFDRLGLMSCYCKLRLMV